MPEPTWRRPSGCEASACVEVKLYPNVAYVRGHGVTDRVLAFTADEWRAFLEAVRRGEFDLPA